MRRLLRYGPTWLVIVFLIISVNLIRFIGLSVSPPGFHFDEAIIAGESISISETGASSNGAHTLFIPAGGGGFASPTHVYPKSLWIKVAGYSISAMRAYAGIEALLLLSGLFFLGSRLFGYRGGVYTLLAGSLSPWIFHFSRMANDDPMMCLAALVWGIYFFHRSPSLRDAILAGFCFSISAYAYSSGRLVFPLIVLLLYWAVPDQGRFTFRYSLTLILSGAVVCSPLIWGTLSGHLLSRYENVGIFTSKYIADHGHSYLGVILIFLKNVLVHFSPTYLFISGDANIRHSTQFVGQLSWLDDYCLIIGLGFLIFIGRFNKSSRIDRMLVVIIAGIIIGTLPAAITWEGLPHSIRGACSWPFFALLSGYILTRAQAAWTWVVPLGSTIAACFAGAFLHHYFTVYPKKAAPSYDAPLKYAAAFGQRTGNWQALANVLKPYPRVVAQYYLVTFGNMKFRESQSLFDAPSIKNASQKGQPAPIIIKWGGETPRTAKRDERYIVAAEAVSPDGLITGVNVWKDGKPFAFAGGGDGKWARSGNPSSDNRKGKITYTAQAFDALGKQTEMISTVVEIVSP